MKGKKVLIGLMAFSIMVASAIPGFGKDLYTVGWEQWEPFQYKDKDGNYVGIDVDVLKAVMKETGLKYQFREAPWIRLVKEVEEGAVDIAMGASVLPEREVYAWFTDWVRYEGWAFFMRAEDIPKYEFSSLDDVVKSELQLGIVRGFSYGDDITSMIEKMKAADRIQIVGNTELNPKKLVGKRIDLYLDDYYVGPISIRKQGLADRIRTYPLDLNKSTVHFMLSKKTVSPEQFAAINKALAKIRESGEYDRIIDGYLK